MPDLKKWQTSFLGAVQGKDTCREDMQGLLIEKYSPRIDIYADCSHETFVQALRLSYPHTLQLLGEECFYGLAADFIAGMPVDDQTLAANSLDDFGIKLPGFLPQWLMKNNIQGLEYLAQLSSLDWLIQQAYHAPDAGVFDVASYAQLDEKSQNNICFILAPSIELMTSNWPLKRIVEWHEQGANTALDIQPQNEFYVLWRQQWMPKIELIKPSEYELLSAIKEGQSLSELASGNNQNELGCISVWIQKGWICGFYLSPSDSARLDSMDKENSMGKED